MNLMNDLAAGVQMILVVVQVVVAKVVETVKMVKPLKMVKRPTPKRKQMNWT
jgi:hypothetical protein